MKLKILAIALILFVPSATLAEPCNSDSDCEAGFECMAMPCSCSCMSCPDGEECPPCECDDCPDGGECIPEEKPWDGVFGNECETDADCPMDFICDEIMMPCAVADCPPCACLECDPDDEDCVPQDCECPDCAEPEECEPEGYKVCRFEPTECDADADCGEGFECMEIKSCSGGGSTGCECFDCVCATCAEGEECPPCDCPDEPVCECDDEPQEFEEECTVEGGICIPKQVACETDEDCQEDWSCVSYESVACTCAVPDCACEACPDGEECEPCDCPKVPDECDCGDGGDAESYCLPDGWDDIVESEGGGESLSKLNEAQDLAAEASGSPEDPNQQDPKATEDDGSTDEKDDDSGCSASGSGSASGMLLLLSLALLALLPRRRETMVRG